MMQRHWERGWQTLRMLHLELPYDPASPLLGNLREMNYIFTQKLVYECFKAVKKWEQFKPPASDEWVSVV
jgi:hypothetical protein